MQYFFILSHLGCNIPLWNALLRSNPFLISNFIYNSNHVYYNKQIALEKKNGKQRFSRFFDILLHNWQTGLKDALDFSKIIYLRNDYDELALNRIKLSGIIHKDCALDYLERRRDFIKQILIRNKDHIILDDDFVNIDKKLISIADFVGVPPKYIFTLT